MLILIPFYIIDQHRNRMLTCHGTDKVKEIFRMYANNFFLPVMVFSERDGFLCFRDRISRLEAVIL